MIQSYVNYVITEHDKNVLEERIVRRRRQLQSHNNNTGHQTPQSLSFENDDNEEHDENMEILV